MLEELSLNRLLRLALLFCIASTKAPTPSDSVGPARILLTVTPVPDTDSAMPGATATCAVFVIPLCTISGGIVLPTRST